MISSRQKQVRFKDSISELNNIRTNALSGNLVIEIEDTASWMLCFASGYLAGISGGIDAIERWQRNLAIASLHMPLDRLVKSTDDREIFSNSNKIAQEFAAQEVLFDIIQFSQQKGDRLCCRFIPIADKNTQLQSILPLLEIQSTLSSAIQAWQEWEKQGLAMYAPSLFPIVYQPEQSARLDPHNQDFQYLLSSIDGSKSLRSIAIYHQKKLIDVAIEISPLLKSGAIFLSPSKPFIPAQAKNFDLQTNPKLAPNSARRRSNQGGESAASNGTISSHRIAADDRQNNDRQSPLIACVDDSIAVYKALEQIIVERGYRCFGVQDPLKIIASLIRNKPDLIFLDLVMPITNGYEVCEQIRKTPSLATVPVVILTGSDGLIDRVRTKFVGANGFLGKPIQSEAIVKMIDKYLDRRQPIKSIERDDKSGNLAKIDRERQLVTSNNIGKQILVIDDDLNIRQVVSMCLKKLKGWDVVTAASAKEGLQTILTSSPDIIILDVMMPEMDGLAFLRQLRSNPATKFTPVVLLTANRYLPDKDFLTELGVIEVVSKPFLPYKLVQHIDRALDNSSVRVG
jgi:two-component system, chemotaxis family, response regulator PixG